MLVFDGAQHAGADFCNGGDGVERDASLLALVTQFFSERTHCGLRRAERPLPASR